MDSNISASQLVGHWLLVDDEVSGQPLVLNPATSTFAPRRAPRQQLLLFSSGLAEIGEGDGADCTKMVVGRWNLQGETLMVEGTGPLSGLFRVIKAGDKEVVLRRIIQEKPNGN